MYYENATMGMGPVVLSYVLIDLQSHRSFSCPLLTEHDGRGGLRWIAEDLVPPRVIRVGDTVFLKNRIGLRILFGKWISTDAVVL